MVHALKTLPVFFSHTADGYKNFEVRKNDRPFRPGDYVALNEWKNGKYTGRCMLLKIVYVFSDSDYCKEDYDILGLEPCRIYESGREHAIPSDIESGGVAVYDRE